MTVDVNDTLTRYRADRDACARTAEHNLQAVDHYDKEIARLEQDPDAFPAAPATSRDNMLVALRELTERRLDAFRTFDRSEHRGGDHRAVMAEATTAADIDLLNDAYRMLDEFAKTVTSLREDVWAEFNRGTRCSVCGNTSAQSAALGYNCAEEC